MLTDTDYQTIATRFGQHAIEYDSLWPSEKSVVRSLWDSGLITVSGGGTAASFAREAAQRLTHPSSLLLKLTGACDFSCTYCYDYDETRFSRTLSTARAQEAIDLLLSNQDHLAIAFHGGEPLLRFKAIREIVAYAENVAGDSKSVSFSIQTNASHMSSEIIGFLEKHHFSVGISIDGHLEAANRLRIVRSGRSALSYVKDLLATYPDFVRRRCGFLMVVGRTSAPHLLDFANWLQGNGARSLGFSFLDNEGAGKNLQCERLSPQEVVALWELILDAIRTGAIRELAITSLLSRIRNLFTLIPRDLCHKGPCGASSEFLVLDTMGQFRTCDCVYHPYFEVGNSTTPVNQLLTVLRPAQERITNRHKWLAINGPTCSECALFGLCGGTCVAKTIAATGTSEGADPIECAVSKYLYPLLIEETALADQPILSYFAHHENPARTSVNAIQ